MTHMAKNTKSAGAIRRALLQWSTQHPRFLPWKQNKNAYEIWVSEIILQQTRVEQGLPYYLRFIDRYPTIQDLASTSEDELMKIWEGLGYYRRARHMLQSAKVIVQQYEGIFPSTFEEIISLKGVGDYTAAAIASFAFDLPYVVVDGNVIRLITRLFGITDPVDTNVIQEKIKVLAGEILDKKDPARFNQAIMDFGSLQCKPANPQCLTCPLQLHCKAHQRGIVEKIPAKKEKKAKKQRYFYYLVPQLNDYLYIKKRQGSDIWAGLFEFYLIEATKKTLWADILREVDLPVKKSRRWPEKYRQVLSHQIIHAEYLLIELDDDQLLLNRDHYTRIKRKKIRNFAFPKVIDCFLSDKDVILNL